MKFKFTLSGLALLFFLSSAISGFAQTYKGKIVEVLDGRTAVFMFTDGSRSNILLQHLEVPEPKQPLHQIVIDHLKKLILDKDAEFLYQKDYARGMIGSLFVGGVEINKQMLRDGAGWFDLPESGNGFSEYTAMEKLAKSEKLGVWSVAGLKPAWEFREDEYTKKVEQGNVQTYVPRTIIYPVLPLHIAGATYIDSAAAAPKDFAVVGFGYIDVEKKKLAKIIKKPKIGDLVCSDYEIPSPFMIAYAAVSELCPKSTVGNNANQIQDARAYGEALSRSAYRKAILGFRMYKVSGNYNEFMEKASDAVEAVQQASAFMQDGEFKSYLLAAIGALQDCMLVRNSRNGDYGARLGGTALLALNDKYGLNDVYEGFLADEIYKIGVGYMNKATNAMK